MENIWILSQKKNVFVIIHQLDKNKICCHIILHFIKCTYHILRLCIIIVIIIANFFWRHHHYSQFSIYQGPAFSFSLPFYPKYHSLPLPSMFTKVSLSFLFLLPATFQFLDQGIFGKTITFYLVISHLKTTKNSNHKQYSKSIANSPWTTTHPPPPMVLKFAQQVWTNSDSIPLDTTTPIWLGSTPIIFTQFKVCLSIPSPARPIWLRLGLYWVWDRVWYLKPCHYPISVFCQYPYTIIPCELNVPKFEHNGVIYLSIGLNPIFLYV